MCEDHPAGKMHSNNKIYLSLEHAFAILKSKNEFWSLKSYVLQFISTIYLEGEIEEAEWDTLGTLASEEASKIIEVIDMLLKQQAQEQKIIFVEKSPLLS